MTDCLGRESSVLVVSAQRGTSCSKPNPNKVSTHVNEPHLIHLK